MKTLAFLKTINYLQRFSSPNLYGFSPFLSLLFLSLLTFKQTFLKNLRVSLCIPRSNWLAAFGSFRAGSALLDSRWILFNRSALSGMAIPSSSMVRVLSMTDFTVYGPLVRGSGLRLSSVAGFSYLSLYPMRGSVVPVFGRFTLRGGCSTYTSSPGCTSI